MPTFLDSLGANPSNSSGIYGQPSPNQGPDVMNLVNNLKDREMNDFMKKANFMSDLSLRQDRMRRIYGLDGGSQQQQQPNVVMGEDPNAMTGYQKADIGIKQKAQDLESQRLAQSGKLGQEAMDVRSAQEKLNQQKSDQINANKQADMERKIEEANQKIELAQKALSDKTANQEAQIKAHQDMAAAVEERHKLEIANKEFQFNITSKQHQDQIDAMQKRLDQAGRTQTTTELNPDGTKKTVTTEKGSTAGKTVQVKGKDGQTYEIPADKVDDWNSNHAPDNSGGDSAFRINPQQ